jgi:hypothetical protein
MMSIQMLQHLTLVRDLKAPLPDMRSVFNYLSGLAQLTNLRLEEVTFDVSMCDLLATYLPTLKSLDCKMSSEYESEEMKRVMALEPQNIMQHALQQAEQEHDEDDDEETPHEDEPEPAIVIDAEAEAIAEEQMAAVDEELLVQHEMEIEDMHTEMTAAATSPATASTESSSPYAAAVAFFGPSDNLPALNLPHLTSLKLPYSRSLRHMLAFTAPLPKLATLQIRRIATTSRSLDTKSSESHYLAIMNHRFAHCYADTLRHLSLVNIHYHDFGAYDFHTLQSLTHLSLTQNSNFGAITRACLETISRMNQLEEVEMKVGNAALEVCHELEWWLALSSIKSLVSFAFWNPNDVAAFDDASAKVIFVGLQAVLSTSHCRLHTLQLSAAEHINDAMVEMISQSRHLHTISFYNAAITLDSLSHLAKLPRLTALEIIACRALHTSEGLIALTRHLPGLRSLSFRLPSAQAQKQGGISSVISDDAWLQLTNLSSLTSLHLSGYGLINQRVVNGWCKQAADGIKARQISDEATLKRFTGFEDISDADHQRSHGSSNCSAAAGASSSSPSSTAPLVPAGLRSASRPAACGVSWQEVRCSGWMISLEQSRALLRALPQLQMLSVHLLETSAGSFTSPTNFNTRLIFAGGDFMQRLIASYITPTHVFK